MMNNNDILRKFRYALDISDPVMLSVFKTARCRMDKAQLKSLLKREDEPGFAACSNELLSLFLDGLIVYNRGKQDEKPAHEKRQGLSHPWLTNNIVLKKLKIALELKQEDLLEIFRLAGAKVSKGELSALFRREGHKNYRECKDQFLRNFFKGLSLRHRK